MRRTLRRGVGVLLAAALAVNPASGAVTSAASTGGSAGAAGIGDRYFPLDGNGGYDVVHYDVRTRVDPGSAKLRGHTRIRARATADLRSFHLDLMLKVSAVTVDGRRAAFTRPNRHELVVTPARTLRAGERFTVAVTYAGRPGSIGWRGERPWLANDHEIVAMGEPHIAAWWFPANDHPRDKATFDIAISVPKGTKGIANGRLAEVERGKRRTTWRWRATDPMAPYLAFFAAGDFTLERGRTRGGVPWVNAVSRALPVGKQRTAMRLMRRTPQVIDWLEGWLGRYPFAATGGLTTSINTGFALENQTRPTYPWAGAHATDLVVHEIAHQWFGNAVSLTNWSDIWLNEGLAGYFDMLWGQDDPQRWLLDTWVMLGSDADFWRLPIGAPGPGRLFESQVYLRGAMTVQALRQRIGTPAFRTLLKRWVTGRTHGTTAEFVALAEEVSGEELSAFFDVWLHASKPPAREARWGLSHPAT